MSPPREISNATQRAIAILQDAIDREHAKRRARYSHGRTEKPTTHDELQAALDRMSSPQEQTFREIHEAAQADYRDVLRGKP